MINWQTKKLGEVCDILDFLRKPVTARDRKVGYFPYYGATGIQDYVDSYIFDEDLVLVGEDGARWDSGDNTAFAISGKTWVNNHAHVLRPHRDILFDQWLIYFLNISNLSEYITGTTVKKLNQEKLRSIPISLPPLATQQKIVARLDELLSNITQAKQLRQEAIADTEKILSQTLREIFEEGKEKFEITNLGEVAKLVRGPFGGSLKKEIFVPEGIAVYEQGNVIDSIFDNFRYFITLEKFEEMKRFEVSAGDILMSCSGTIGKFIIIPNSFIKGIINQALLKITPKENITVDYLKYALQDYLSQSTTHIKGGAIKNIASVKELKEFQISLPPLPEQYQIVTRLDTLSVKLRELRQLQAEQLEDLKKLEKAYLREAFSGELV
jgi:type I restriction enzyme S subunit